MELRWIASFSASCLYAARALLRGEAFADPALAAALAEPARELAAACSADEGWQRRILEILAGLSAGIDNNQQLAERALVKAFGAGGFSTVTRERVAMAIGALELAFRKAKPTVVDELAIRGEPLKQLWEARGPGLLKRIGELTEPALLTERAEVVLVYPALGGGGIAQLNFNSVHIEAVLANPRGDLPEVVRLGWLLAQLHQDLPSNSETIPGDRLPRVAALAMIPPALAAAEEVELARNDPGMVAAAIDAWLPAERSTKDATAATLSHWWETYHSARPRWPAALGALDVMLEGKIK